MMGSPKSQRRKSRKATASGSTSEKRLPAEIQELVRRRWRSAVGNVITQMKVLDVWCETVGQVIYRVVRTESGVKDMFREISKYLAYKKKQDIYSVMLGFGGYDISRKGEVSVVAFSVPQGRTWVIDTLRLREAFWQLAKPFLTDPQTEKIVFDGKHIADYLLNVHGIEFRGMYDLLVLEAMERGRLRTVDTLPTVQIPNRKEAEGVTDRRLFLNMDIVSKCYLAREYTCAGTLTSEEWDERSGVTLALLPDSKIIEWIVDYQKFLINFFKRFNFVKAFKNRKYLNWWVSSERYCSLLSEKTARTYNEIETSPVIPNYILCFKGTDQPLGIVRCEQCSRFLPTKDFSFEMLCNMKPKVCVICLKIIHKVICRSADNPDQVVAKKVDVTQLEAPASLRRSFKKQESVRRQSSVKKSVKFEEDDVKV